MAESSETKYCSNCKSDVPCARFQIHDVHCRKHMVLCDICDEPISIREKEEHFKECHAPALCDLCGASVPADTLSEHKEKSCQERSISCPFCQLPFKPRAYDEHKDGCGSRTDVCELCNQRVMLREMAAHRHMNCHTAKVDEHPKPVYDKAGLNYGIARSGVSRVVDSRFKFPLPMPGEEAGSPMQAAMKLQDEFNDRTRMEDGDTSLARELQMELEGTGEQGGYRNGNQNYRHDSGIVSPTGLGRRANLNLRDKLRYEPSDGPVPRPSNPVVKPVLVSHVGPAPMATLNDQLPNVKPAPVVLAKDSSSTLERDEELARKLQEEEDQLFNAPRAPHRNMPYMAMRTDDSQSMPCTATRTDDSQNMPYTATRTDDSRNMPYTATRTDDSQNMPYTRTDDSQGYDVTRSRRLYSVNVEMSGDDGEVKLPCEFCKQQFSMARLTSHQALCQIAHEKPVDVVGIMERASTPDEPVDTMVHCHHCMEQYPESYVRQHESVCEHNPEKELLMAIPSGLGRHQATPPLPPPPPYPLSTDNVQVPCEFCCQPFSFEVVTHHQAVCDLNPDKEPFLGRYQASPQPPHPSPPLSNNEENQISCQFCYQQFPFEVLGIHQAVCDHNPEKELSDDVPSDLGRHQASPPPPPPLSSEDENQVPCEFCNELFPFDRLTGHQAMCNMGHVRRELTAPLHAPGRELVGGYGGEGDYRGGIHGEGDYRGGVHGEGDCRGGVHGEGDYRGVHGEGDYRGGVHGEGDYREGVHVKGDRGGVHGEGDYRGGVHGIGDYRGGVHVEGDYRGGVHGEVDYDYRQGDHGGDDHHSIGDPPQPWMKRQGSIGDRDGSSNPTPFEKRSGLGEWSRGSDHLQEKRLLGTITSGSTGLGTSTSGSTGLGTSTSVSTGQGIAHPPLMSSTDNQYVSETVMDSRTQHKAESHHRGNHTTVRNEKKRDKPPNILTDVPFSYSSPLSPKSPSSTPQTQGSPLTHEEPSCIRAKSPPLRSSSHPHQSKLPVTTYKTSSGHTASHHLDAGSSAMSGLSKPKGSHSKTNSTTKSPVGAESYKTSQLKTNRASSKDTSAPYSGTSSKDTRVPYSGTSSKDTSVPYSGTSSKNTRVPYSGTKDTSAPYSGTSSKDSSAPYSGTSSKDTSVPYSGTSSKDTSVPYSRASSKDTSVPYSGTSSKDTSVPYSGTSSKDTSAPYSGTSSKDTSVPYSGTSSKYMSYYAYAGRKGTSQRGPLAKGREKSTMETKLPNMKHAQREDGLDGVELQISKLHMEDTNTKPKDQPSVERDPSLYPSVCPPLAEDSLEGDHGSGDHGQSRSGDQATVYKRSLSTEAQGRPNKYPRVGGHVSSRGNHHNPSGHGTRARTNL